MIIHTVQHRLPLLVLAAGLLAGCMAANTPLPPPPAHANGQVLWRITHEQCVPDQNDHKSPAPCALVNLKDGYVILKDQRGIAQHLLMPTAKITGIEDPELLQPDAANYFADAWQERHFVGDRLGRPVADPLLSIAVNSAYGRSQDQLHLHIDCVDATVAAALRDESHGPAWSDRTIRLKGHAYRVHWLRAGALQTTDPFKWLAGAVPGAKQQMGAWTLAVVGGTDRRGQPGVYLLADRANPLAGDPGSSEELQDHSCAAVVH